MEYCSLTDAFPEIPKTAGAIARKEERKKAKKCKGPPLTFLEPGAGDEPVVDPDRPAVRPSPEVPPLNRATGLREHAPSDAPLVEPFSDQDQVNDLIATLQSQQQPDNEQLTTLPKNVPGSTKRVASSKPSFFGANYDDSVEEGFASFTNVIGDDPSYHLTPDFNSAFAGKGADKASGLPIPSVNDSWKPMTSGGATTSFYSKLQAPVRQQPQSYGSFDKEEYFKKLDTIYARLDDLESRKGENSQTEILLFVMSGIFVLFSMDLLVRKTGNVRILQK